MSLTPLYGSGIVPASGAIADQLTALTRRSFVYKLIVQIYNSTPTLQMLLDNAQFATGGIDPITVPVQGSSLTTFQWSGYSGTFNQPSDQPGATNAQATLKLGLVPIPFLGMEGAIQVDAAIIPIIEARMNDAMTVMKQGFASAIYLNTAALNNQAITGFKDAIDDGTNTDSYMGILRSANPWWKAQYVAPGAINPTRALLLQYIAQLTKHGNELPTMATCNFGTWMQLASDFLGLERYNQSPGSGGFDTVNGAFQAIMVGGVPIYPDFFCAEGDFWFFNANYLNLYIHNAAKFAFSGFHSAIPNFQIGFIGVMATILELVNAKPATSMHVTGLNYVNI
jgi:hypothetical protein